MTFSRMDVTAAVLGGVAGTVLGMAVISSMENSDERASNVQKVTIDLGCRIQDLERRQAQTDRERRVQDEATNAMLKELIDRAGKVEKAEKLEQDKARRKEISPIRVNLPGVLPDPDLIPPTGIR